jgi:hypothetical protein
MEVRSNRILVRLVRSGNSHWCAAGHLSSLGKYFRFGFRFNKPILHSIQRIRLRTVSIFVTRRTLQLAYTLPDSVLRSQTVLKGS